MFFVIWLAIVVLVVAGLWKVFVKAGEPGWAALVPIYNLVVLLKIAGKPLQSLQRDRLTKPLVEPGP